MTRGGFLTHALLWAGLLAAPLAWAGQLIVGYGVEEADCSAGGRMWGIETNTWEIALLAATVVVALLGCAAAVFVLVGIRRRGRDPLGRLEFMAGGGILISGIFLALILLGGAASVYLEPCSR